MQDAITGEKYWKDTAAGIMYRRIVNALAWPFDTMPGAICVLGEVRSMDPHTHTHRVNMLHDEEINGVDELLRVAHGISFDTGVFDWVARRDVSETRIVDQFNRVQSAHRMPQLRLSHPQEGDERERFRFWIRLLERRTMDDKTLTLGDSACIRNRLMALPHESYAKEPEEFPAVAALLFALAEIDLRQPLPPMKFSRTAIDPLAGY